MYVTLFFNNSIVETYVKQYVSRVRSINTINKLAGLIRKLNILFLSESRIYNNLLFGLIFYQISEHL